MPQVNFRRQTFISGQKTSAVKHLVDGNVLLNQLAFVPASLRYRKGDAGQRSKYAASNIRLSTSRQDWDMGKHDYS